MRRLAAALALLAAALGARAATLPLEISAEYQLSAAGLPIGRVKESFQRKGDTYAIRSETRSEGVLKLVLDDQIVLSSSGRIGAAGLQPLAFAQHRAKDSSGDIEAAFDWERGVMRSEFKGAASEVPLPPATQDRLSVMYQFMNLERREGDIVLPMSNGRKVELYTYRFVGEQRVATPAGEFETLHYARVTASPKESHAEIWLAKDRFNFPVRVVFDDSKGLRLEQTLLALQSR